MLLLTIDQNASLRLVPVDRAGNPARVDGVPTWKLSDAAPADPLVGPVAHLEIAADAMSALLVTDGTGVTQVQVSADADLGEGVRTITGTLDVQVESGEAVALNVLAATPVPK